jgi:hypothetical protein
MNTTPSHDRIDSISNESHGQLPIKILVLYTGFQQTLAAVRCAAELACGLDARIEMLVTEVVPYPLPIDAPPVVQMFSTRRYQTLIEQSGIETSIHVCLCRDRREALEAVLEPGSIVVIGARRRMWPTKEYRLGQWLRKRDHRVIFVEPKADASNVNGVKNA